MGRKGPELSEDHREIVVYEVTAKIIPLGIISANLKRDLGQYLPKVYPLTRQVASICYR